MKYIAVRLAVAVITFAVGVSAALVWVIYRKPVDIPAHTVSIPEEVNFADLVDNPERFVGRTVRFRAVMSKTSLGLHRPGRAFAAVGYDFDPDAGEARGKVRGIVEDHTPQISHYKSGPCGRAAVTVSGKVVWDENKTRLGLSFGYWVMIQEIENVEPCPRLWFHDA